MEANLFVSVVLPSCLAVIMFGMGSTLIVADFKRVFALPKALVIGLLGQMLLLPFAGFWVDCYIGRSGAEIKAPYLHH